LSISEKIIVVVPTYNEAESLPRLAEELFNLNAANLTIIVVDDNSPDGTAAVAKRIGDSNGGSVRVIQRPRKLGLGTAYKEGFERALKENPVYVVQMDADLSHPPQEIPAMIKKLKNADVVVGSRYADSSSADDRTTFGRRLLSSLANQVIRVVAGLEINDITSGFKVFRREALENLDWSKFKSEGFAFQTEVAHACQRKELRVIEHPIVFRNRAAGRSKMTWAIGLEAIIRLLPLRFIRIRNFLH